MKKYLFLALLLPLSAAAAFKTPQEVRFMANQGDKGNTYQLGTQLVDKKVQSIKLQYNYATVGGASGSVSLLDVDGKAGVLPANSIIVDCIMDVRTSITSSGFPKLSVRTGLDLTDDLKASSYVSTYSGLMACVPVGSAATAIRITTQSTPKVVITTASTATSSQVLAGKLNVILQYIMSE